MTKIKVTINNVEYEFDSIEEAEKAFPNINKKMDDVFDKTDQAFEMVDEAFRMVDGLFESMRKPKRPITPKPNIKVPPQKPKPIKTCGCICDCNRPVENDDKLCKICQGKPNKRVDIKALLKDPIEKAKMIANAVRTSRFFK